MTVNVFEVMASLPPDADRNYRSNRTIHVVSDSVEGALYTFKREYPGPDISIHKVERRQNVDKVLIDGNVAQMVKLG